MATTRRLKMEFALESDDKMTLSIPDPKTDLNSSAASACMTAIVENGDAWVDPVKQGLKATVIETTTTTLVDNT